MDEGHPSGAKDANGSEPEAKDPNEEGRGEAGLTKF